MRSSASTAGHSTPSPTPGAQAEGSSLLLRGRRGGRRGKGVGGVACGRSAGAVRGRLLHPLMWLSSSTYVGERRAMERTVVRCAEGHVFTTSVVPDAAAWGPTGSAPGGCCGVRGVRGCGRRCLWGRPPCPGPRRARGTSRAVRVVTARARALVERAVRCRCDWAGHRRAAYPRPVLLSDKDIRAEIDAGRCGSIRTTIDGAAVQHRCAAGPLFPGVRESPLSAHRSLRRAGRSDAAGRAGGRRAVHPASR